MNEYFNNIDTYFSLNNIRKPDGCSESEIDDLEKKVGFELPRAYKEYLSLMGRDYDGVMCGTDCFVNHATENTEYLSELLKENDLKYALPENYLAFFCHQGYIISWFELPKKNDNPICYYYHEAETTKPIEIGTFSEFMSGDIIGMANEKIECRKIEVELKMNKKWWQFWV